MIYIVVGFQYGYDEYYYENVFASTSLEKAEEKMTEIVARKERQKQAEEEYWRWNDENQISQSHLGIKHKTKKDFEVFDAITDQKKGELAVKYNLKKGDMMSGHLDYEIQEIPSTDEEYENV